MVFKQGLGLRSWAVMADARLGLKGPRPRRAGGAARPRNRLAAISTRTSQPYASPKAGNESDRSSRVAQHCSFRESTVHSDTRHLEPQQGTETQSYFDCEPGSPGDQAFKVRPGREAASRLR